MATLKQRLHKKNSSGTYDIVHLETSASLVLMSNGTTVEAAINGKAASSHNHAAGDITSGTLAVARGGTGVSSLDALKSALGVSSDSYLKYEYGTYKGTGSCGINNPNVLTFTFVPKILFISAETPSLTMSASAATMCIVMVEYLTATYKKVTMHHTGSSVLCQFMKRDNTTISWYYNDNDPMCQLNHKNSTYYYTAIG